jgi:S-layer homology domain
VPTLPVRRRLLGTFAAILMAVTLLPIAPARVAAAGGQGFVEMANGYRADAGLGGVAYHAVIDQIAIERGRQIKRAGELGHDFDYLQRRFAEEGICWTGFGEIVAYNGSGDFAAFGTQWFNSTTHRNIMLGDYTHAGGSREEDNGRWYGVMVFVKICGALPQPIAYGGFTDIAGSNFRDDIVWMAQAGITTGCSATKFCPDDLVHRDQMATFLRRAEHLPSASRDWFADDATNPHQDSINRVADAGIARACETNRYCPKREITRAQMAAFVAAALSLPSTSRDYFTDDNDSAYEGAINRIAAAGITTGCGAGRFCPGRDVTRAQMAAFLHRAYD